MGKKKNQGPKPKHVPQRTCIACRQAAGKRSLIRIVRTAERIEVDPTGKKAGRGAYVHADRDCWQILLDSRRVEQALRRKLSPEERQDLHQFMQNLSETGALHLEEVGSSVSAHE
jgi:predicted RNA-binding protein YlxR (DUF448 family)